MKNNDVNKHPSQRFHSPSRGASAILHLLGLLSNVLAFNWLLQNESRITESYGWHFQYLTICALSITTITLSFGLLSDITRSQTLFNVKNKLSIIATPLEVMVSMLYYGLLAIDPKLVIPLDLPIPPRYIDMSFHLFPVVVLVIDLLFFSPPYVISTFPSIILSTFIALGYFFWVEHCHSKNNFYPYPIFEEAGIIGRFALCAGGGVIVVLATAGLKIIYKLINGQDMAKNNKTLVKSL